MQIIFVSHNIIDLYVIDAFRTNVMFYNNSTLLFVRLACECHVTSHFKQFIAKINSALLKFDFIIRLLMFITGCLSMKTIIHWDSYVESI